MRQDKILKIFRYADAILTGHFKLSSGLHSEGYLQCALVLQHPRQAKILCRNLANKFKRERIDVVIGPALGGIIVSYEVACFLGARSIFAERRCGKMEIARNFTIRKDERVLV